MMWLLLENGNTFSRGLMQRNAASNANNDGGSILGLFQENGLRMLNATGKCVQVSVGAAIWLGDLLWLLCLE